MRRFAPRLNRCRHLQTLSPVSSNFQPPPHDATVGRVGTSRNNFNAYVDPLQPISHENRAVVALTTCARILRPSPPKSTRGLLPRHPPRPPRLTRPPRLAELPPLSRTHAMLSLQYVPVHGCIRRPGNKCSTRHPSSHLGAALCVKVPCCACLLFCS